MSDKAGDWGCVGVCQIVLVNCVGYTFELVSDGKMPISAVAPADQRTSSPRVNNHSQGGCSP